MIFRKSLFGFIFLASQSFAAHRVGNGGWGIEMNGSIYLVDLVEAHQTHFEIVPQTETNLEIHTKVLEVLGPVGFSDAALSLLANHLTLVNQLDPDFYQQLSQVLTKHHWSASRGSIPRSDDHNDLSSRILKLGKLVQLAYRLEGLIQFDMSVVSHMNDTHQVALALHELVYASLPTDKCPENKIAPTARTLTSLVVGLQLYGVLPSSEMLYPCGRNL